MSHLTYSDPSTEYSSSGVLWDGDEFPDAFLVIGGKELDYINGSLRIKETVDRRSTMRLKVESDVDLEFNEGERVTLYLKQQRAFTGALMRPAESYPGPFNRVYGIEGVDWHYLADRRVITRAFLATDVETIVKAIISEFLADDDVSEGTIDAPAAVEEAVFSYVFATSALDKLAELGGYHWFLDHLKRLNFGPINSFPAPFDLDEITEHAGSVKKTVGNRNYRNRQFLRGGKAETEDRVESWSGDDEQRTFVVGFPIAREPSIKLNTVLQTVDVKGIGDENSEWFWARGSTEVTQNQLGTPISPTDALEITYKGLFDLIVLSSDTQEIVRRQQEEGFGTGTVDSVVTDPTISSVEIAFASAAGKLQRFGVEGLSLSWDTEQEGLAAGQLIHVALPDLGLANRDLLIMEITTQDKASRLIRSVRAVDGPDDGDWTGWFQEVTEGLDPIAFRENLGFEEVLIVLTTTDENWTWEEDIVTTVYACLTTNGTPCSLTAIVC